MLTQDRQPVIAHDFCTQPGTYTLLKAVPINQIDVNRLQQSLTCISPLTSTMPTSRRTIASKSIPRTSTGCSQRMRPTSCLDTTKLDTFASSKGSSLAKGANCSNEGSVMYSGFVNLGSSCDICASNRLWHYQAGWHGSAPECLGNNVV